MTENKSAYVRAMANTLIDAGVHPSDSVKVILELIRAGWKGKDIEKFGDAAAMMAMIRQYNSEKQDLKFLNKYGGT